MKINTESFYRKMLVGVTAVIISIGGLKYANSAKSVEASTACIVTIFDKQYDVTSLGTMHPGPQGTTLDAGAAGFFQCGSDMTAAYQMQHGIDVTRLVPFLVSPTSAPTIPPTTTVAPTDPSASPTPSPIVTLTITPSASPSPTITASPSRNEREDDMDEVEEEHEDRNIGRNEVKKEEKVADREENSNHGTEVRAIAKQNHGTEHDND